MRKDTLLKLIVSWWKEHEYDITGGPGWEERVHENQPEFVTIAMKMMKENELDEVENE